MSMVSTVRRAFAPVLLCAQLTPSLAWAQQDPKAAAHEHYDKGIAAFDDERFQDAADEFEAAYRISPAFAVLYNLGRVYVALGRPVEAMRAFETYLAQGAATVDRSRVQEVRAEIEKQRARIGSIALRTVPPGAEVRVDGKLVGKTPLADPVRVAAGKHTAEAFLSGYAPLIRDLTVGEMAQIEIELRLDPVAPAASESAKPPPSPAPAPVVVQLAPAPAPAAPTAFPSAPASGGESAAFGMPSWGYVIATVGIAGAGAGTVVALLGVKNANDARDRAAAATAPSMNAAYDQARTDFDSAKNQTVLGWAIAGVGAGVLLGGVLLVVMSPDRKTSAHIEGVGPWVTANAGGVELSAVW
jgi:tetratricopeptide (TPR) repeat protein